ncbi:Tautomerase/MIF superfamily [Mycena capillaripes]|nr:Tautomerase/MIF superfamily [Mycena capillaripes]
MPYLELVVNVQIPNETEFSLEFAQLASKTLDIPISLVSTCVVYNKTLTFAGTLEPAFSLSINCLEKLNPEANKGFSAIFSEFITSKLKIGNDRGYVKFVDPGIGFVGFQGTTAAVIFGRE